MIGDGREDIGGGPFMWASIVQDFSLPGIFVRSKGEFDADHMRQLIQVVSGMPIYDDGIPILHDMRSVAFDVPADKVFRVSQVRQTKVRHRRLALVHDTDLGFGMCRTMASLYTVKARETQAFRTLPVALEWLFPDRGFAVLPSEVVDAHQHRLMDPDDGTFQVFQDTAVLQARVNPR